MKKIIYIISLLILATTSFAYDEGNCFPGKHQKLSSPSNKFEFILSTQRDQNDSHVLLYHQKQKDNPRELLKFERNICINWSPDESFFSITDNMGSNISEVYIFKSDDISSRIDVMDILPLNVSKLFGPGNSHGYLEVISWYQNELIINAYGDRDNNPKTFDILLSCSSSQNQWSCKKKSTNYRVVR